jgi:hypothetical protein
MSKFLPAASFWAACLLLVSAAGCAQRPATASPDSLAKATDTVPTSPDIGAPSPRGSEENDRVANQEPLQVAQKTQSTNEATISPGEYSTDAGWGRLQINATKSGKLDFSIESVSGEYYCSLAGEIVNGNGLASSDSQGEQCVVEFHKKDNGLNVAPKTVDACRHFCGWNGGFEGHYLRVTDTCRAGSIEATRARFKVLYDARKYKSALAVLSPVLKECLPVLQWEDEGDVRNDIALTQYKNGLYSECLKTLDRYADDAKRSDDEVVETWTPALADRYLSIVRAARTNIELCSSKKP